MPANDFLIRPLTTLDEFQQCVEIQGAVWGYDDADIIPRRMFLIAHKIGGQVLGAARVDDPGKLAGFAMGLPAYRDGQVYLHSHMLAVLPEHRNAGLGRRLKLAQRDDAIARGIERMEWTYDPLEIKNSYLNIAKLGAISRRYQPDFYGPSSSPLQGGLPTDRLYAEWWLRSPRVEAALRGETLPQPVLERITVPAAIAEWKQTPHLRDQAKDLQTANRIALQSAFERGLAATGYVRDTEGNGIFLLGEVAEASISIE
jgi:predicted GNAT superfamily acetyltransferase